ncbi:hypothetical protein DSM100688_0755 [Bifidobacterium ramosum]|uniref:Uncharacterized protein n=1 Tax=Bifidobacterium ramosum TaxID=1798158 RepID=A0A6L4X1G5_9BIFI|nr:hypothetical protein [Bifidobacterium ramosum]KAB8288753.1 hypothetical protein DSM100688_0755 [Bifidobacterium ramosum]NEG71384.1 hypothetical protein [Bifidobacterium ramosum]
MNPTSMNNMQRIDQSPASHAGGQSYADDRNACDQNDLRCSQGGSYADSALYAGVNNGAVKGTANQSRSVRRPMWWWLLAAFLAFAVIVTGAFVWQRTTSVSAQKIYDELVSLDPNVTEDQLTARGYVYGGQAAYDWHGVDDEEFPAYETADDASIDRFMSDVRAGRESVLRLVVRGVGPSRTSGSGAVGGVSVRVLWFDPSAAADWAEKDDSGRPATIHHDGKGQIREWWWRDGAVVISDKRFARGIQKDEDSFGSGFTGYVLKHQPAIPSDPDSPDTVITRYDENLCMSDNGL